MERTTSMSRRLATIVVSFSTGLILGTIHGPLFGKVLAEAQVRPQAQVRDKITAPALLNLTQRVEALEKTQNTNLGSQVTESAMQKKIDTLTDQFLLLRYDFDSHGHCLQSGFEGLPWGRFDQPSPGDHPPNFLVPIWPSANDTLLRTGHPVAFPFNCTANQNRNQR
jgi:hypothetical protein